MRLASFFASLLLLPALSAPLVACGDDGTLVDLPHARDGINGGVGSPNGTNGERPDAAGAMTEGEALDASADAGATIALLDAGPTTTTEPPAPRGDAGTTATHDAGATTADGGAQASVAGCACGCADACLTELIVACEKPTALLLAVCPKVPATCACDANCAAPAPAPPSLDACVAQFLLTGA